MSLDLSLIVDDKCVYSANITHNLAAMAEKAGIYRLLWKPEELGATKAADVTEGLRHGLHDLGERQSYFEQFNSPNSWGKYQHLVSFVSVYLEACLAHPSAQLNIRR